MQIENNTLASAALRRLAYLIYLAGCCLFGSLTVAQEVSEAEGPSVRASFLQTTPILDGQIQGDPAWDSIEPISNFTQILPDAGSSASMKTEVYIGYTSDALHIGFVCFEDDINDMYPSGNGWESDGVVVVLDTYQNQVTGYGFSTNQVGAEWDTSLFNGNTDWNWATVWSVKSQINEDNWSSELVIPFTSLNYPNKKTQDWGINFSRYIHNRNEVSTWAPIPRQFSVWRLALAGTLKDIRPPPPKRNVKFMPYVLSSNAETTMDGTDSRSDWGFDVRYSLTPTLNLDATYNTDFAQVESDSLRINTGRFSLFFPETRSFFLENAQLFNVGVPRETLLFHSRSIGISNDGRRLPIEGGIKLTGTASHQNHIGFIHMRAESNQFDTPEDFTVARYRRDLYGRSTAGLMITNRSASGLDSQTIGGDLQWQINDLAELRTFVATTSSSDGVERDDEYAYSLYANYNSPKWRNSASYHEVGSGFNPAIGFAQRTNTRKFHVASQRTFNMGDRLGLNEWLPNANYTEYRSFDGFKESGYLVVDSLFFWKNGANLSTAYRVNEEGLKYPFQFIGENIPAGSYRSPQFSIGIAGPQNKNWNTGGVIDIGEFYHGNIRSVSFWTGYTPSEFVNVQLNHAVNQVDFPESESPSEYSLSRLALRISFTPKLRFSTLLQYNSADDVVSINSRFSWLRKANSGLYVVFNGFEENNPSGTNERQTFVIKYSHLFDINL